MTHLLSLRERLTAVLLIAFCAATLGACGGPSAGSYRPGSETRTTEPADQPPTEPVEVTGIFSKHTAQTERGRATEATAAETAQPPAENKPTNPATPPVPVDLFAEGTDNPESAAAVDDDIWRLFQIADEYHAMGVIANREASWEEAQYYFEKAIGILANLDIEADSALTPEAVKFEELLENVIADYRVAMRSLGRVDGDAPPSVLVERFANVADRLEQDTIRVFDRQETEPITHDLPVVMNERVRASIIYFQGVGREAFEKFLSRRPRYEAFFREVLTEYGLPQDLIYLSMIESGYNPNAYSWARAMGLWQFIASTGRLYNLNRDWWIDERKDPVKATHAAAQFLRDLYKKFGDWELAMAAYNGGPGRVSRAIKRDRTDNFWEMKYLRRQTKDYVPLIYAATIIAKEPEKYGFGHVEFENPIQWEEVTINKAVELSTIAEALGVSTKELKTLNPELLRGVTPPNRKNYKLKVPVGKTDRYWAVVDDLPTSAQTSWVRHKIRRGETVSTIASRYGVSQYAIREANKLNRRSTIYAGRTLIVPVPHDRSYASSNKSNRTYEASNSIYTVRSGDTMWDIARAFGTSVSSLRAMNSIGSSARIYVGQRLKIPATATKLASRNTTTPAVGSTSRSAPSVSSRSSATRSYTVRRGDTLWEIARKYGMTTSQLRALNGLGRSSRIYPGQKLTISGEATGYVMHRVRRGDTLSGIARSYRTSVARIMEANNLRNPDEIRVGARLKITVQ